MKKKYTNTSDFNNLLGVQTICKDNILSSRDNTGNPLSVTAGVVQVDRIPKVKTFLDIGLSKS